MRSHSIATERSSLRFRKNSRSLSSHRLVSIPDSSLGKFFALVKDMTVDAYYKTEAGLKTELGWHGNTFLTEFKAALIRSTSAVMQVRHSPKFTTSSSSAAERRAEWRPGISRARA